MSMNIIFFKKILKIKRFSLKNQDNDGVMQDLLL